MNLDPQLSWQIRRFFFAILRRGTSAPAPSRSTQKYVKMIINETIYSYSKRSKMNKHMKHSTPIQARTMWGDSRQFWYLTSVIQWSIRHNLDTEFWYTHLHTYMILIVSWWTCCSFVSTIKLIPVQTTASPSICCNTECTTLHIVVRQHPRQVQLDSPEVFSWVDLFQLLKSKHLPAAFKNSKCHGNAFHVMRFELIAHSAMKYGIFFIAHAVQWKHTLSQSWKIQLAPSHAN